MGLRGVFFFSALFVCLGRAKRAWGMGEAFFIFLGAEGHGWESCAYANEWMH